MEPMIPPLLTSLPEIIIYKKDEIRQSIIFINMPA